MAPRPGMIPPHLPPGMRPPVDITRPPLIPQSTPSPVSSTPSPSPSPSLSQASSDSIPTQPLSVPVSLADARTSSSSQSSEDGSLRKGPAKVTPAQVTVPLQEQAPWPPAATTPAHISPPGIPAGQTAPPGLPAGVSNGLGAVGSSRPQSVSGANATPGNNRPVKQPQAAQNPGKYHHLKSATCLLQRGLILPAKHFQPINYFWNKYLNSSKIPIWMKRALSDPSI